MYNRWLFSFWSVLLLFACVSYKTNACGITTHIETGERASQFFAEKSGSVDYGRLLSRNSDALQAGSPYPDAFYPSICFQGIYHQVAEDTHWTPFLNATVNYIRKRYPQPWDSATEKLVVFLFGIVQHQVADVNWHSLGIDQGFLETMGKINYHGSFGDAHSAGDVGGDILNVFGLNMNYVGLILKWYVPIDDLVNIYEEMYGQPDRMPANVIQNCTFILFMGRLGESLGAIDLLYPLYSANSPFLLDALNNYYLGGIDDMAVWSSNVWKRTVLMLDQGTEYCSLPNNPIYIRCNETSNNQIPRHRRAAEWKPRDLNVKNPGIVERFYNDVVDFIDEDDVIVKRTERGVEYSPSARLMNKIKLKMLRNSKTSSNCEDKVDVASVFYTTRQGYSRLGEHVTSGDVNNDGYDDAIISAPGYSSPGNFQQGRVYVVYGSENGIPYANRTIETTANVILDGLQLNSRFGQSVAVVDLNADGFNDLAVSAPSVGSDTLDYFGQVYVYLSTESGLLPAQPSITIDCTDRHCNFGWMLKSGDINADGFNDLIIGSPFAPSGGKQRGLVAILLASKSRGQATRLSQMDLNWTWSGDQDYEWAGFSVAVGQTTKPWLAIGSPTYRKCTWPDCRFDQSDIQSVGRVSIFEDPITGSQPISVLVGSDQFEQFGYFVSFDSWNSKNVLIVSSISANVLAADTITGRGLVQSGVVKFFEIIESSIELNPLLILNGDRDLSRFGSQVLVYDAPGADQSSILVSAPFRSDALREDRERGRVYLFTNSTTEGTDVIEPDQRFAMDDVKVRFGSSIALISAGNKKQLLIGAQHYTTLLTRLGGATAIIELS